MTDRQRALELLSRSKAKLQARFGVTRPALFGSTARDTASSGSDVDVRVAFDGPDPSKRYFDVRFYLEDLPGCPSTWSPKRSCGWSCVPISNRRGSMSDAGRREWRF